tara:strand:- start:155 stop:268 length:114 start_codon:yes stop_codon:yes gene_type:complete
MIIILLNVVEWARSARKNTQSVQKKKRREAPEKKTGF